jgi:class 3 adenylate cyclase
VEVRKTVTVLFADVAGSTALGEHLDPESLRGVLARYFDEMRSAVEGHGGTIEKFIGDAVMAVFGVPVAHEDDALRAVRAASEMRESVSSLNAELERDWGARIQVRTGVNTGEVVAGDPSAGQSFVTGDAVNLAARLEQAAEPGEILIGEETQRLVRDAVRVEPVEPLELKGKAKVVTAFRLLEVRAGAAHFARRLDSPLVGRTDELAALERTFDRSAVQRSCYVVTVVGDAGVGKSRLVNEFVMLTGDRARTLWGHCLPYGDGITFWPIAEVVKDAAGITGGDSPQAARAKVRALVADVEDGPEIADRIDAAIGLGDGEGDIKETFWAARRLLEKLAGDGTLVVVFEDVHWAEPAFLDLVEYLARFSINHPMFVLCTARPNLRENRPDWAQVAEVIELEPLSEGECERLIENLLGRAGLAGDIGSRIADAAEGNPLFVEEMLRMLIDEGSLVRDNGRWTARGDLDRISVPGTISALLSARLDQLEAEERAVIQWASVIGKVFWWGAVRDLAPEPDRTRVGSHLQTLMRKELVRPDRSGFAGEDAFRFSHILVRDAAYESLPKSARAELHERFASWLERKAGERIVEFEEIIGYHLEQAFRYHDELGPVNEQAWEVASRAARRLSSAGRRALARWDLSATVNLLSRSVDLLPPTDERRLDILLDLGLALTNSDMARAHAVLTQAMYLARSFGDSRLEGRAGVRRLFVRILIDPQTNQEEALREVERYVELFEGWNDDLGLAEARRIVGVIRFWQGRMVDAEENLALAITHAQHAGDRRLEGQSLRWLSLVISEGPLPASEGLRRLHAILDQYRGDRTMEMYLSGSRAVLEAMLGELVVARQVIGSGNVLAGELGDQVALASLFRFSGQIEMLAGDPVAAEAEFRAAYEIVERISDIGHLASIAPDLGDAVYEQGRYDEALGLAELTERITIAGDLDANVRWRQLRSKALARLGRTHEAEISATEAIDLVAPTENLDLHAHALLGFAEMLRIADRKEDAASAVRKALELYRQKENVVAECRTESLLQALEA